jgi:hypothetical protein
MNEIYIKWYDKLGDKFVKDTIEEFNFLEREFYEDRNKKQILDTFFQYESSIRDKTNSLSQIQNDISQLHRRKHELTNYIINKLRNENKLIDFLANKDRKTLGLISTICDIKHEYNKVDMIKFEEEKRNRGKNITMNLNN